MKLFIDNEEVKINSKAKTFRGENVIVRAIIKPQNERSTGRVYLEFEESGFRGEYFPGVIGAEWRHDEKEKRS